MIMNNNPYQVALAAILPRQATNIARHTLASGETVWVRKAGKSIPQWRYTLIGYFAAIFHLNALKPVPNPGGRAVIATEAARLQILEAYGVHVPHLLARSADGIMFTHLGEHTLLECIEHETDDLTRWQQGLDAIRAVHEHGQYLSEPFARNIIACPDGSTGFIDFEEDPGQYMSFTACESRDYLCYLQSTAIILKQRGHLDAAVRLWHAHTRTLSPTVVHDIQAAVRPLLWMRCLHHPRWGKDPLRLAALAELIHLEHRTYA